MGCLFIFANKTFNLLFSEKYPQFFSSVFLIVVIIYEILLTAITSNSLFSVHKYLLSLKGSLSQAFQKINSPLNLKFHHLPYLLNFLKVTLKHFCHVKGIMLQNSHCPLVSAREHFYFLRQHLILQPRVALSWSYYPYYPLECCDEGFVLLSI